MCREAQANSEVPLGCSGRSDRHNINRKACFFGVPSPKTFRKWNTAVAQNSRTSPCGLCRRAQAISEVLLGFSGGSAPQNVNRMPRRYLRLWIVLFWNADASQSSRTSPSGLCRKAQANSEVPLGFSGGSVRENINRKSQQAARFIKLGSSSPFASKKKGCYGGHGEWYE